MRSKHAAGLVLIALAILSVPAIAQEPVPKTEAQGLKRPPVEIIFTGGLGVTSLKTSAADKIQAGTGGLGLDLGGGVRFLNIFDIGVGLGMCWLADHNQFTNSTTGGERSSSVWPLFYYAQAGFQAPIPIRDKAGSFKVWAAFHAGTMGVSVDRSIMSCTNCDTEKLSLKGGWFYTPEIRLQRGKGIYMGLGYTIFCSCSELKSRIMVTVGGHLWE